jgi:hypothetical protein
MNEVKNERLEERVSQLPSLQQDALSEIMKGMYAGKPLLGNGGLLTKLIKDLPQLSLQGEMDGHLEGSLE